MRRFRGFARLLAANLGVLVGLLAVVNLTSAVVLAVAGRPASGVDPRAKLANYDDHVRAELMFKELHMLRAAYEPFEEWTLRPFQGLTTTVDSSGSRVQPNAKIAPPSETVVHFFGGSTMFGTGSEDGETIPAQFAQLNTGVAVENHGRSGFNTRQNLEQLISLLNRGERVDVAVFYFGVNDVASLCRRDASINGHEQEARMRELLDTPSRQRSRGRVQAIYDPLLSQTVQLAGKVVRRLRGPQPAPGTTQVYRCAGDADRTEAVVDVVKRNLTIARDLVSSAGGQFIAVLQPVIYVGQPEVAHLGGNVSPIVGLREQFEAVYPMLREQATTTDWWFDDTNAFDGNERFYIDYCHVSPNGNRRMASRIASHLERG